MAININIPSQVAQTITNGVTGTAPSQDAVFDALQLKENAINKGLANGYAPLNASTKIDSSYLPSYVDDVIEVANYAALPVTGETGKIYITLDTNFIYRWSGTIYIQVGGGGGGGATWGTITGTLSNQTDLQNALDGKYDDPTGTTLEYIRGDGTLATFPTALASNFLAHSVKYGVALTKGQAVYVSSANGTNMIVTKSSNVSEATSSKTMGLVTSTGALNYQGQVLTEGLLSNIDTSAANAAGDPVWLGVDGNLIFGLANKPSAPAHLVFIGIVTRKNSNTGEIFVRVQNGFEIQELHNVSISSVANNDLLVYNSTSQLWENKTIPTALGYTPANQTITISTTSPLSGGGDLSANRTLSISDAAADGTTKGAATFSANDFDSSAGLISIDYTNGQAASTTNKGFLTATDWNTFNGKADINPRVQTVTSAATVTPTNLNDLVVITAQAAGLTIANPTGTMVQGQALIIRIKDNGTARAIGFGTNYRGIGIVLPTTTVISKTLYLGCIWNSTDTKFDVLGLNQEV